MRVIFVAGTDTGVGKSLITGLLGRYLLDAGYSVVTQKWVQTGCRPGGEDGDISIHLKLMDKKRSDYTGNLDHMVPYSFNFSSSAHLAARLDKKRVSPRKIEECLGVLKEKFDFVIVEGSGGLMMPLSGKLLLIDLVQEMGLPVILVSGNRLGAINHTLLSIEAIRYREINNHAFQGGEGLSLKRAAQDGFNIDTRQYSFLNVNPARALKGAPRQDPEKHDYLVHKNIELLGVIFNEGVDNLTDKLILKDNILVVKKISGANIFGSMPYHKNISSLRKSFILIGKKICQSLKMTG